MVERKKENTPEFEQRAQEFIERVFALVEIFPDTDLEVVNLTKDEIDLKSKLITWYESNNFLNFANIEKGNLKEMKMEAKRKNVVQVIMSESNHEELESFISEVNLLASYLAGEKLENPLFRDWGVAKDGHKRFVSTQSYSFNKS